MSTANIEEINFEQEMKQSFLDYGISVIQDRALPDVRDGLKPVHRRILYGLNEMGMFPDKPYKKSARIVGDIMGKYHPHGDSSVYNAMVRLSQDWKMNLPMVDGHGNFGSVDGDSAAAMRYTEARLAPFALTLLEDMEKGVVDMQDNFDGSEKEPVVLPAMIPNLLITGSSGIAVGMKTEIPPHNGTEVSDAFFHFIENPKVTIDDLLEYISAPDYPTGGIITNPEEIKSFYRTGEGKVVIRARHRVEPATYGKTNIVITEIPYTFSGAKQKLIEKIIELVVNRKLDEISDVRDESSKDGIRIVLEVKKGVDIDKFLNKLWRTTKLQDSESYQFRAIVDGEPKILNLLSYFEVVHNFQKEITTRKYNYLLAKALDRKEVVEGLVKAQHHIDAIIEAVRGADTSKDVKNCLMNGETSSISWRTKKSEGIAKKFDFTERQVQAILDIRLQRLMKLEVASLEKEYENLLAEIEKYQKIVSEPKELTKVIRKEIKRYQKLFNTPRKTEVRELKTTVVVEKKKVEDVLITLDKFNYVKAMDVTAKDKIEDNVRVFETRTDDKIAMITNKGRVVQVKVLSIPNSKPKDRGKPLMTIAGLEREEYPLYISTVSEMGKGKFFVVSNDGYGKQVDGTEFVATRSVIEINKHGLACAIPINNGDIDVIITTTLNTSLRFGLIEIPEGKRKTKGVKTIELIESENERISEVYLIGADTKSVKINEKDIGIDLIPKRKRGKKGMKI